MIYVADISSVGIQHEQFNSSFIQLLQNEMSQESITFFADPSHIEYHRKTFPNVLFKNIDIYNERGGLKEFYRAYTQYKNLNSILKSIDQTGKQNLIVLLIHPFAHFLFKVFSQVNINVTIVMHGELESLKFNKHFVNKIWGFFLTIALKKYNKYVSYIILGESIYKNLITVLPLFSKQRTIVLDHPYPFTKKEKQPISNKLVFSSIGVATIYKYTYHLFEIAEKIKKTEYGKHCVFNICGRVYRDMEKYLNDYVEYKKDFGAYTRKELEAMMNDSTFAVFYYDNTNYSLCASGAFWDAVNAELPFLYIRNDYFDYYNQRTGGIGMVFDTPEQLNEYINEVAMHGVDALDYGRYVANIQKLKYNSSDQSTVENILTR